MVTGRAPLRGTCNRPGGGCGLDHSISTYPSTLDAELAFKVVAFNRDPAFEASFEFARLAQNASALSALARLLYRILEAPPAQPIRERTLARVPSLLLRALPARPARGVVREGRTRVMSLDS